METYEVTHIDGTKGRLTEAEVKRLSSLVKTASSWEDMHEVNKHYKEKAQKHVKRLAGWDNDQDLDEDDLKSILYSQIPHLTADQADLIYEIIEVAIGLHSCKLFKA